MCSRRRPAFASRGCRRTRSTGCCTASASGCSRMRCSLTCSPLRVAFDGRWKYAAGGLSFDYPGFVHTVLVDMRARLRASEHPDRIFEAVLETAKAAGLGGRRRGVGSASVYDAVATMDTVTLIRSAIRGLLAASATDLEGELRGLLARDDDYASAGKPVCDYEDRQAREAMIDALAKDAHALLVALDGRELPEGVKQAGALLAAVVGQDLDEGEDGVFRIARRVAKDRIISTVDPEARHGHKTAARGFDGYKGHIAIDPDSEIITSTAVTAANASDGSVAAELLTDVVPVAAPGSQKTKPSQDDKPVPSATSSSVTTANEGSVAGELPADAVSVSGPKAESAMPTPARETGASELNAPSV